MEAKDEVSYYYMETDATKGKNTLVTNIDDIGPKTLDVSSYCGVRFMTLEEFNQVEREMKYLERMKFFITEQREIMFREMN